MQAEYNCEVFGATNKTAIGTPVSVASTGDKFIYTAHEPIEIVRWGLLVTTTVVVGTGSTFALDMRPTLASDTNRVEGALADGTLMTTGTTDVAAGDIFCMNCTPIVLEPSQQVVLAVDNAPDSAGIGYAIIWYRVLPFVGDNLGDNVHVRTA